MPDIVRVLQAFESLFDTIRQDVAKLSDRMESVEEIRTAVTTLQDSVCELRHEIRSNQGSQGTANGHSGTNGEYGLDGLAPVSIPDDSKQKDLYLETDQSRSSREMRRGNSFLDDGGSVSSRRQSMIEQGRARSLKEMNMSETEEVAARKARISFMRKQVKTSWVSEANVDLATAFNKFKKGRLIGVMGDLVTIIFGIRRRNPTLGIDGSRLVHPSSPWHAFSESLSGSLLIYCAFMVPVQLTFWNIDDPCWV